VSESAEPSVPRPDDEGRVDGAGCVGGSGRSSANKHPRVEDGTLVSLGQARHSFPAIPGVNFPVAVNESEVLDFGPDFNAQGGRLTVLPPVPGSRYQVLVPKPDKDGQDIAGIRPMEIRVPIGTHTGWNIRSQGSRAPDLCGLSGSFVPFARTKTERLANGDPRRSLEERYQDHRGYVNAVKRAAKKLVEDRFLIPEDADRFIREAEASNVLR
jgi:Alpha/beta hydrolase domain